MKNVSAHTQAFCKIYNNYKEGICEQKGEAIKNKQNLMFLTV